MARDKYGTKTKKAYLKYKKRLGNKAKTYGQWKQAMKTTGSAQHRKQMIGLSRQSWVDTEGVKRGKHRYHSSTGNPQTGRYK